MLNSEMEVHHVNGHRFLYIYIAPQPQALSIKSMIVTTC